MVYLLGAKRHSLRGHVFYCRLLVIKTSKHEFLHIATVTYFILMFYSMIHEFISRLYHKSFSNIWKWNRVKNFSYWIWIIDDNNVFLSKLYRENTLLNWYNYISIDTLEHLFTSINYRHKDHFCKVLNLAFQVICFTLTKNIYLEISM